ASDLVVRAFPLLDGRLGAFHAFCREVHGERAADAAAFYERHGVARETWHLQDGPDGHPWVIAVTHITGKPVETAAADYAAATEGFDAWLKSSIRTLCGVDPDTQPLGPPTECVFDSTALGGG
ncbi:MAG: hypothetical protein R2991_16860, partial [Thermoanaerobaculia bacterium]